MDCTGSELFVEDPLEDPKDLRDLEVVTCTLIRHLASRPAENVFGGLKHLSIMLEYTLQLTRMVERYVLYPPILQVAYNRLWSELTSNPTNKYPVDDVVGYGAELLRQTSEGCTTPMTSFGLEGPTVDVALYLSKVDFFNLLGRLFLSYNSCANESNNSMANEIIPEACHNISIFGMSLAKYIEPLCSAFEPYQFDWLKTLRYIAQLSSMCLPSCHLLLPHLEQLISAWRILGEAIGFSDHSHKALPCSYDRCPGFEDVSYQSLACGKCLYATYCSARCQQTDWMYGDNPHRERCYEGIGDTKFIEGS
ncbi:hypothetical protein BDV93DRAFT_563083 [Ceratobasidium sp. AG-I]|nr:hypothetical protein BDV93DRAFT_563083 [Ceratobasidium sp. AG-I]